NRVRALAPKPGATVELDEEALKVLRTRSHPHQPVPGALELVSGIPVLGFADGGVELVEVQPSGGRAMPGADWARGRHGRTGTFQ
ncbi:MAG TPA: methionyl-tRNA formyltransferase, partial [Acidimicrobiia bacterium]|nr:methionyl-tRNA formyltransferase [Acidimicrobiia bacterium]